MTFAETDLRLDPFVPILPFMTGHSQTILGHLLPSAPTNLNFTETVLKLDDGDELFIEYYDNKSETTISIYHGLAGDSSADYIRRTASLAHELRWNLVLVNHRGASEKASSTKTYHSGRGEDAGAVISWARKHFPGSRQVAVGFSMSGSILLNLLTGRYGTDKPDFAIVVNAPLDLKSAAEQLTKGLSRIYDYNFYLTLKALIQKRQKLPLPPLGRTLDIDNLYTSKMNGFKDAYDYYEKCSAGKFVGRIDTKTFVLSAYDDPFISVGDYLEADWSSSVHVTLMKHGGHMGYVSKKIDPRYGRRWLDHYLESVFEVIKGL